MRKKQKKRRSVGVSLTPVTIVIGLVALIVTAYVIYRASYSDRHLFSISFLPLLAGVMFESRRLGDWRSILGKLAAAYALSLFTFLPGKNERNYNFENHIQLWPYFFLFIYLLLFAIFHEKQVTAKLTEGVTMLLSASFVYWLLEQGAFSFRSPWLLVCGIISIGFFIFSVIHCLSNIGLSKRHRLWLSMWSTIVVFVFAIDNVYQVYKKGDLAGSNYFSDNVLLGIQYFFLGISAVYIMQNFILLSGFIPSKNSDYKNDLKENIEKHVERYSEEHVTVSSAILGLIYVAIMYTINHYYLILPLYTSIWFVIFSFSFILYFLDVLTARRLG